MFLLHDDRCNQHAEPLPQGNRLRQKCQSISRIKALPRQQHTLESWYSAYLDVTGKTVAFDTLVLDASFNFVYTPTPTNSKQTTAEFAIHESVHRKKNTACQQRT